MHFRNLIVDWLTSFGKSPRKEQTTISFHKTTIVWINSITFLLAVLSFTAALGLLFAKNYVSFSSLIVSNLETVETKTVDAACFTTVNVESSASASHCVGMGFNETMDDILSKGKSGDELKNAVINFLPTYLLYALFDVDPSSIWIFWLKIEFKNFRLTLNNDYSPFTFTCVRNNLSTKTENRKVWRRNIQSSKNNNKKSIIIMTRGMSC